MLEIVLSLFAGAAVATIIKKIPRNKQHLLTTSSNAHIQSKLMLLKSEKAILTKTISRLQQNETRFTKTQQDKLLLKYQNHLAIVLANIEKLEKADKYPDLGPIGDGLMVLMDKRLSKVDQSLSELSSKISLTNMQILERKKNETNIPDQTETKRIQVFDEKKQVIKNEDTKTQRRTITKIPAFDNVNTDKIQKTPIELVTLTNIPKKYSQTLPEAQTLNGNNNIDLGSKIQTNKINTTQEISTKDDSNLIKPISEEKDKTELKIDPLTKNQSSDQMSSTHGTNESYNVKLNDDDYDEDDDRDELEKLLREINLTTSKIDEAEVE